MEDVCLSFDLDTKDLSTSRDEQARKRKTQYTKYKLLYLQILSAGKGREGNHNPQPLVTATEHSSSVSFFTESLSVQRIIYYKRISQTL